MINNFEKQVFEKIRERREQSLKQQAAEVFSEKKLSDNWYYIYTCSNVGSWFVNFFSAVTGSLALCYFAYSNLEGSIPYHINYAISGGFGAFGAILIEVFKRRNSKTLFSGFINSKNPTVSALIQIPISAVSIILTFYACFVFPSVTSEVQLKDIQKETAIVKAEIAQLESDKKQFRKDRLYKNRISTEDSKEVKRFNADIREAKKELKALVVRLQADNEKALTEHKEQTESRGYLLGYISLFLELFLFPFFIYLKYYYLFIIHNEGQPAEPIIDTLTGHDDSRKTIQFDIGSSVSPPVITDQHSKIIDTNITTEHIKQDRSKELVGLQVINSRCHNYKNRVKDSLTKVEQEYNSKNLQVLKDRLNNLIYWNSKRAEIATKQQSILKIIQGK